MKNISVFAVFVIIFFSLCVHFTVHAEASPYALSAAPLFSIGYGQSAEMVFHPQNADRLISELLWDMKNLYSAGLSLEFSRSDPFRGAGFFAAASLRGGLPVKSGAMEDRDWLTKANDNLTNYSHHDAVIRQYLRIDGSAGASIPVFSFFFLKIFAGVSFMRFSFSAENGYAIYARENPPFSELFDPIDENPQRQYFDGKTVITYSQDWLIFTPGISAGFRFLKFFEAGFFFR